ncbi:MAG: ATP-binding protein [Parachlamydiaceae bacterium]|nr:ATP-binding protein [Parachlamydiaceae bacterium]
MQDFEKLGVFYLGKVIDSKTGEPTDNLLLYDSKNFTTHAVCVGMTGSGKTGLGIAILEEAALDKIPSIIIDPKGDLGNLLLTFPHLSSEEFQPWVDSAEAERKGKDAEEYAKVVSKTWNDGLAASGEGPERIQKLKNSVEMAIYTPASKSGIPLSILSSFEAPPKELLDDSEAMRDRVLSTTSSLLGLIGVDADPIKSREHILISTIIDRAWNKGIDLDIATLIQQVQKPPFDKIGVLDIDTFFSQKDRLALSINLNNLLASPGFKAWMEGDPLDIQQLLYTKEGKPKLSIISIAHLSNAERMFFVTLLLNEFISWMRVQPGTSSLRAILYMDEIFGFFPPIATPPSKLPMITLLKQARAYGVGVVLCTQNPVDLDYKGLSNCGTWFIGKLQTERDKARVLEGLNTASNGEIQTKDLDKMMSSVKNRTFIMRSIYEKDPIIFQTRWTMSYLRGPLTLTQIAKLTKKTSETIPTEIFKPRKATNNIMEAKPTVPIGIPEFFLNMAEPKKAHYVPQVIGLAKLHFVDAKNKIDQWQEIGMISDLDDDGKTVNWDKSKNQPGLKNQLQKNPLPNKTYDQLPSSLMSDKNFSIFEKEFTASLYQNQTLTLFSSPELSITSNPDETEGEFRARLAIVLREKRDEMIKKIRDKYENKINVLTDKVRRAQGKVTQQKQQVLWQKAETFLSFLTTIIGAFFRRGISKGTITETGTSMRRAGRIGKESQEATNAEENYQGYQQQLDKLQAEMNTEITNSVAIGDSSEIKLENIDIRPRKSDIAIEKVGIVWVDTSEG